MLIRIVMYILAALLLGAHFLRASNWVLVVICLAAPFAFLYRRKLSLVFLQAFAYGAAATWLYTAWQLVQTRQSLNQSWTLAAAILGAVALYSLLTGLLLNSRVMHERFVN